MQLTDCSLKRNDDLAWRIIDGEAFVVHPQHGLIYPLDCVATRIWELVDGRNTFPQIVNAIQDEFDEDDEVIARDVSHFLRDLLQADLVSRVAAGEVIA